MTLLVVSPHLDDAVLSVPGLMRARALRGERVVVLTVFSEGDDEHVGRRAEDLAALALLGVEAVHLGLRDAPLRRGLRRHFRDLVLGALGEDDADAIAVTRTLVAGITSIGPSMTLLPLGVGEHIDHRIVHAVHAALPGVVGFYEDRPYASIEHAARGRLLRIGATVDGRTIAPSHAAVEAFMAAALVAPHVRAYVPAAEREACLRPLAAGLAVATPASGRLALRSERLTFSAEVRAAAVQAVRAYGSQLADLFGEGGVAGCFAEPYAECVYWRDATASTGEALRVVPMPR
jgi:LmbE family N-acetylglucosaminyl deacetylase